MDDHTATRGEPIEEIASLRQRIAVLEATEARLQESEQRYRSLTESTTDIIYIVDRQGHLLYANRSAARAIGLTPDDIAGRSQRQLFPPGMAENHLASIERVFTTGEGLETERLYRFGPTEVWLNTRLIPLRDERGQITSIMGVSRNVTEHRRMDQALQQARDELEENVKRRTAQLVEANEQLAIFRRFVEASDQGFGIANLDGYVAYVNPALTRILGKADRQDTVGRHMSELSPSLRESGVLETYRETLLRDGHWSRETRLSNGEGGCTPILHSSFLIRDDDGQPAHLAAVVTDITDRKRSEELLRKEQDTLRHLLKSSDHERQLIAYEIHDGLAQYLAGAIMQFQTFAHRREAAPAEAANAFDAGMKMLHQGHFEARRLISGVRPPVLDESGVVEALAHLVHEHSRAAGPRIDFHSDVEFDRLAPAMENAVYRIAQEGLLNACRHSESERVRLEIVQEDEVLRISIVDNGVGFYVADTDTEGNHFGLAGIRERTRLLGGVCKITSKPGVGTRITVRLPLGVV
jgi:PAS domain S-box-containing protein